MENSLTDNCCFNLVFLFHVQFTGIFYFSKGQPSFGKKIFKQLLEIKPGGESVGESVGAFLVVDLDQDQ